MSFKDNTSGLVLDKHDERTIHIDLPLVTRHRYIKYGKEVVFDESDEYGEMIFFGDWHTGNEGFAHGPFNSTLKFILDNPHVRVGLMGDYFEYSVNTNYISDEVMDIDEQMDFFVKVVRQIRDQIEFVLPGNHDSERLAKYTKSRRWLNSLCAEAGVDFDKVYVGKPQRGVSGFVNAGDQKYSFYATHGRTGAIVNKNTQLKRMALSRRHTLLLMGHIHHILWEPQIYTEPQADGTHEIKMQYWLATGGFLKDPSYAEAKSYPMSVIGAPIVRFFSTTNDLDMWQLPYRSHQFKGGIESIVGGTEGIRNWEYIKHGYGVVKKCLL